MKGFTFKSVSELVSATPTPRLVSVKEAKSNVEKNDVLIIKKTGKTMLRKAFVKVTSLNTKEEKTLYVSA